MVSLNKLLQRTKLYRVTDLLPVFQNVSKCSCIFEMLLKYQESVEVLQQIDAADLDELRLSCTEEGSVQLIFEVMKKLKKIVKAPQAEKTIVSKVQDVFTESLIYFSKHQEDSILVPELCIVSSESGVMNMQLEKQYGLRRIGRLELKNIERNFLHLRRENKHELSFAKQAVK